MFKLDFPIPESKEKITLKDLIYTIGSCFSDDMGRLFQLNKFNCLVNPFGTVYNPYSIFKLLQGQLTVDHTTHQQGIFYHWDLHGSISSLDEEALRQKITERLNASQDFLKKSQWLIMTPGTSWVYRLQETREIVANCHKSPRAAFAKELLSTTGIKTQFQTLLAYLRTSNPDLKILFTISPVRHIRDGLIENNRSKAILLEAIHELVEAHPDVHYFPSYEIVLDELRDYRFYASDMIHPSKEAVEYVWKRFSETYFDPPTQRFLTNWTKIQLALQHQPFHPESAEHQQFLKQTLEKLVALKGQIDVEVEIQELSEKLK